MHVHNWTKVSDIDHPVPLHFPQFFFRQLPIHFNSLSQGWKRLALLLALVSRWNLWQVPIIIGMPMHVGVTILQHCA